MAGLLRMEYAVLDACADQHLEAAQGAREIDQERQGARLPWCLRQVSAVRRGPGGLRPGLVGRRRVAA